MLQRWYLFTVCNVDHRIYGLVLQCLSLVAACAVGIALAVVTTVAIVFANGAHHTVTVKEEREGFEKWKMPI